MPDSPLISGGPSSSASNAAASIGIALTAHASAHTKATTWTEIIASTTYAANWLQVNVGQTGGSFLVDIGVGTSTAEQTLIANLYAHTPTANIPMIRNYLFPLRIPTGTRISGRCQNAVGGASTRVTMQAISSGIAAPPGLGRVETIGANTTDTTGLTIDTGAVAHTDVIGELTATTGFAYRWMCVAVANPTDNSWVANTNFLFDVVKGAGGSEVAVINDLFIRGGTGDDMPRPSVFSFPCSIAAGERVAIRVRSSITTDGDRDLDFVGYGVG